MHRRILPAFLIVLAGLTPTQAAETKAPLAKMEVADGDTIVFLGDSITQQCLYTQYLEDYFYTRFPDIRLHLHNAGVSGDTAADALARFDRDVAAYKPRYVTILLGMNDGAADHFDSGLFDRYRADMQTLVGKIQAIGATPIVLSPTMYDVRSAKASGKNDSRGRGGYYNGVLALYGTWLREMAAEEGLGYVDLFGPLNHFTNQTRKTKPTFTLIPDGIHPDPGGQMVMVFAWVSDLGLSRRIATIDLSRASDGSAEPKVTGGKIADAQYTDDGVSFTFHPASLPMPVPADAQAGANLIPLGHRMSYEALYVHSLVAGHYRIFINDQAIGDYSSQTLESKLETESNPKTPQYQQAMRVAGLNAERNEKAIAPLRNLWKAKKILARTKLELERSPSDPILLKRVAAQERPIVDFEGQIQTLEREASRMEDEIYRASQPGPLKYRIVRVSGSDR